MMCCRSAPQARSAVRWACLGALVVAALSALPARAQFTYIATFKYGTQPLPSQGSDQEPTFNLISADPGNSAFFAYQASAGSTGTSRFTMATLSADLNPSFLSSTFATAVDSNPFTIEVAIKDTATNEVGTIDIGTHGSGTFGVQPVNFSISTFSDGTHPAYAMTSVSGTNPSSLIADHTAGDAALQASMTFGGGVYHFSIASTYNLSTLPGATNEQNLSMPLSMTITPVPEPTFGLCAFSGLAFVARVIARRKKSAAAATVATPG
jgi:hypothetical protein